jgi:hypothetical protein
MTDKEKFNSFIISGEMAFYWNIMMYECEVEHKRLCVCMCVCFYF